MDQNRHVSKQGTMHLSHLLPTQGFSARFTANRHPIDQISQKGTNHMPSRTWWMILRGNKSTLKSKTGLSPNLPKTLLQQFAINVSKWLITICQFYLVLGPQQDNNACLGPINTCCFVQYAFCANTVMFWCCRYLHQISTTESFLW